MKFAIKKTLCPKGVIARHLDLCDLSFIPPLSTRVKLEDYAERLSKSARNYQAYDGEVLVGLVAAYFDSGAEKDFVFISNVSVLPDYTGLGIAKNLLFQCIEDARLEQFKSAKLSVNKVNSRALNLYQALGFSVAENSENADGEQFITLEIKINNGLHHEQKLRQRNP